MRIYDFCPKAPDFHVDYPAIIKEYQWIRDLEACPQDVSHHAEGNVLIHVGMVCAALAKDPFWRSLPESERQLLFTTAMLHDVAKPATTKEEDGKITAKGHARVGAIMARKILWEMGMPFDTREHICSLIAHHLKPYFILERDNCKKEAFRIAQTTNLSYLLTHARADVRGRICEDQEDLLCNIDLFEEYCKEEDVRSDIFNSDHSRFVYFNSDSIDPHRQAYDSTKLTVTMMSALPGSGKDYWIKNNISKSTPVISLDEIRAKLKIKPTDDQGTVIAHAKDVAKGFLRSSQDFVWNATNITKQMRSQLIELFSSYNARVKIVYIETSPEKLRKQNSNREYSVPEAALEKMMRKWEVPDKTEAHEVHHIVERDK